MVNDVEKRFSDEGTFRRAATYTLSVIGLAVVVAALTFWWAAARARCSGEDVVLCDTSARVAVVFGPGAVLLLGGIGAFVITYLAWRRGKNWVIWQGAGWFLFVLMTVYFAIGGSTAGT
ncbi:hypothetical protein [Nocardia sp. XZ_19_385]|uniref:hypothetical protein n=1 Tax=Nocardia sp. XZ_19_385 TaxID=2769488 RepID=UPI00189000B7|nr:hypothetical protein [Nocardia sp. XZ_19_385]